MLKYSVGQFVSFWKSIESLRGGGGGWGEGGKAMSSCSSQMNSKKTENLSSWGEGGGVAGAGVPKMSKFESTCLMNDLK